MNTRKFTLMAGTAASMLALSALALAAEDHNSSRSNLSQVVPGGPASGVTYSFTFNFSTTPGSAELTKAQYELVVDQALAQAKADIMEQYAKRSVQRTRVRKSAPPVAIKEEGVN